MIFKFVFLQIEDLQNQIKEAERKVDEKRSILETSQVLECEQDDAEKISLIEQICMFVFFHFQLLCQLSNHQNQMQEVLGWISTQIIGNYVRIVET